MRIVNGNLWSQLGKANLILFTSNAKLNRNMELVMGAGVALQAKKRFPLLPSILGCRLAMTFRANTKYGICLPSKVDMYNMMADMKQVGSWHSRYMLERYAQKPFRVGAFQTKIDFRSKSTPDIVENSVMNLMEISSKFERIALNFPAIGYGGLTEEQVLPIVERLPDNVYIYKA